MQQDRVLFHYYMGQFNFNMKQKKNVLENNVLVLQEHD